MSPQLMQGWLHRIALTVKTCAISDVLGLLYAGIFVFDVLQEVCFYLLPLSECLHSNIY